MLTYAGALRLDCAGSFPIRVPTVGGGAANCKAEVRVCGIMTLLALLLVVKPDFTSSSKIRFYY
jgi:hypothetical protein